MIEKKKMLMFISQLEMLEVSVIIPTLSWVAEQAGMVFEAYLGSERDGVLLQNGQYGVRWQPFSAV